MLGGNVDRIGQYVMLSPERLAVLRTLWYEGAVVDSSGRANHVMMRRAEKFHDGATIDRGTLFSAEPMRAVVHREINGRRTKRIALTALPERWLSAVEAWAKRPEPEPEPQPEPAVEPEPAVVDIDEVPDESDSVVAAPEPPGRPVLELEIASSVATALLTQVVEIITAGTAGDDGLQLAMLRGEINALEERLGEQVGYVNKLRRQVSERSDELAAVKLERDALRRRVRDVEHNLKVATGTDARRIIDAEVQRQVDRVMRQAPASSHGSDDEIDRVRR